jgi:hypothetical protein
MKLDISNFCETCKNVFEECDCENCEQCGKIVPGGELIEDYSDGGIISVCDECKRNIEEQCARSIAREVVSERMSNKLLFDDWSF